MVEKVIKSVQSFGKFSKEELSMLSERINLITIEKNSFILEEGQTCQAFYFIQSGGFRHFTRKEEREDTLNLWVENDWMLDYQSFTSQKPSKNSIQASENSEVYELGVYDLHHLIESSKVFFQLAKILETALLDQDIKSNYVTPDEKYAALLEGKPTIVHRFPMKHIASYLGITPETLSRVRSKISK